MAILIIRSTSFFYALYAIFTRWKIQTYFLITLSMIVSVFLRFTFNILRILHYFQFFIHYFHLLSKNPIFFSQYTYVCAMISRSLLGIHKRTLSRWRHCTLQVVRSMTMPNVVRGRPVRGTLLSSLLGFTLRKKGSLQALNDAPDPDLIDASQRIADRELRAAQRGPRRSASTLSYSQFFSSLPSHPPDWFLNE